MYQLPIICIKLWVNGDKPNIARTLTDFIWPCERDRQKTIKEGLPWWFSGK